MPYVTSTDDVSLYYKDWSRGEQGSGPVVFIHGWPLNADMWEYQMTSLVRQGVRCVAYDRRGFGRSGQPADGYDYDTFADDLKALLDGLDLRDATLVGFSMGGGEIARYLSRHGAARIRRVALVSSVVPFLLKTSDHPQGVERGIFDGMVAGLEEDRPHFLAQFARMFYGVGLLSRPVSAEILDWSSSMAMQASPLATVDCVRAFSETDFRGDLASFGVPTLVIHGDADQTVPPGISGRAAAAAIVGARYIEYAGAPHATFLVERVRLTRDLLEFVRG